MTTRVRRISVFLFVVLCFLVPSIVPAQAAGPFAVNATFLGAGTCDKDGFKDILVHAFSHTPTGTVVNIEYLNSIQVGSPNIDTVSESTFGPDTITISDPVPASSLPYIVVFESKFYTSSNELVVHTRMIINCSADGIATGAFIDLLQQQGEAPLFTDGRINPDAAATVIGYCNAAHAIEAYLPNGKQIFVVTVKQIKAALAEAVSNHTNVLVKQAKGQQLWALASNQLQFHDATGNGYDAVFAGDICGD